MIRRRNRLALHPTFVQIEHDGVGCFVGVGDVCHKVRMDRIATVRSAGIVEVDDEKLRLGRVRIEVLAQMVVSDFRQVRIFIIIDIHRE